MSDPERTILDRLLDRLGVLQASLNDDLAWMEAPPQSLSEFEAMASHRRSASRAVLKSYEQMEDQLSRAFRIIPKLVGKDSSRWYARDYGDFMEQLGILDDAATWSRMVRLRNELVHDYPLDPAVQFDRLVQAVAFIPQLRSAHERLAAYAADRLPDHMI